MRKDKKLLEIGCYMDSGYTILTEKAVLNLLKRIERLEVIVKANQHKSKL